MDSLVETSSSSSSSHMNGFNPTAISQRNVEAMLKVGRIWATGWQDMSKTMAVAAQSHLDDALSNWKALSEVKTLSEAISVQTGFARTSIERAVTETTSLTSASIKLAEATLTPITAWVNSTTERLTHRPS